MPPRDPKLSAFREEPEAGLRPTGEPMALSVSALVAVVNRTLGDDPRFVDVWVLGEVSGFRGPAASGHWYFELKDDASVLQIAMFRGDNALLRFRPENGMELLVRGRVAVYQSRLQLVARDVRPVGVGPLQIAFEQLRRRLESEGLFREERKRPLPRFPRAIGVVTSLQGAVLRDIVRTLARRFPGQRVLVAGARVQGEGAAEEVARAIHVLNADASCDVIVVARGGGSMEDLWAFNEETVVRAVVASRIPVVSAVGHETDFTLCDFAADRRASTPTAAAEMLSPDAHALRARLAESERRLARALRSVVPDLRQDVDAALERAEAAARRTIAAETDVLAERVARLHALSPLDVLARGYAVVRREGRVVRALEDAPPGSDVEIVLPDGAAEATIKTHRKDPT